MARSSSTQPKVESGSGATCDHCGVYLRRNNDLPRHMVLHAKNKEEFMYSCPVEGCTHQTLQKSNLATHIRTHTRAKPHKCPEYFPNGQKCDFATADPSSLHRHRKRKHGYKSKSFAATSSTPTASGSGTREASVSSSTSFESEESFGLRPATYDADPSTAQGSTDNTLSYSIHAAYLASNKLSAQHYDIPYYLPLDLKFPDWIASPAHLPSTSYGLEYGHDGLKDAKLPLSDCTDDASLLERWPQLVTPDFNGLDATPCLRYTQSSQASGNPLTSPTSSSSFSYESASVGSPPHSHQDLPTFSPDSCGSESTIVSGLEPFTYLPLPSDLFPTLYVFISQ
ncbi:hypothetical protein FB451DRAFT_335024 [Mycena latifolia]|nr:hypothetical protein FB451DRAFT_335024 [Mycena latifolia]